MNIERLENIADHKSRVILISLFGKDMISEDPKENIPDQLKKLYNSMKNLYINAYLDCMRNANNGMSLDNE